MDNVGKAKGKSTAKWQQDAFTLIDPAGMEDAASESASKKQRRRSAPTSQLPQPQLAAPGLQLFPLPQLAAFGAASKPRRSLPMAAGLSAFEAAKAQAAASGCTASPTLDAIK